MMPNPNVSHTADEEAAPTDSSELRVEAKHIFEARLSPSYVPTTVEDIRATACEQLATYLRDRPTLPGDPSTNFAEPWPDLDSGVRLPFVSCSFKGCKWKHHKVAELLLHLLEAHHDAFEEIAPHLAEHVYLD